VEALDAALAWYPADLRAMQRHYFTTSMPEGAERSLSAMSLFSTGQGCSNANGRFSCIMIYSIYASTSSSESSLLPPPAHPVASPSLRPMCSGRGISSNATTRYLRPTPAPAKGNGPFQSE